MTWELIDREGELVYKYTLPEGKIYYIPQNEFTVVKNIFNMWPTILARVPDPEDKAYLTKQSCTINSKCAPPVDTKFYATTDADGKHHVIMSFPNSNIIQKVEVEIPFTHHFLIQEYENENDEKVVFFGALEKQAKKEDYMIHKLAEFNLKESAVPTTEVHNYNLRNNEVYFYNTQDTSHIIGKSNNGVLFREVLPKSVYSTQEKINSFLLSKGVLPRTISARVKRFFPHPDFNIEPLVIKTQQFQRESIPPLPKLILHEHKSTTYHYLRKGINFLFKRRTLMYYLGENLAHRLFYYVRIFSQQPPQDIQFHPKTLYVYPNINNKLVYQTRDSQGQEVDLSHMDSSFHLNFYQYLADKQEYITNPSEKQTLLEKATSSGNLPNISLAERAKIAQECCEEVYALHEKGLLIVDLKPHNFVHGSHPKYKSQHNFIIDDESIISIGERPYIWTDKYVAPELVTLKRKSTINTKGVKKFYYTKEWNKIMRPTIESDIFSMGKTVSKIFDYQQDELANKLCKEMTWKNPQWRLSLPTVINLLNAYLVNEECKLVDFTFDCFTRFEKKLTTTSYWKNEDLLRQKYHVKLENLGKLLHNLSGLKLDRSLTYFEQQTCIQLIDRMPTYTAWNTPENLAKLLDPKKGPLLTSNLLGSFDYLEKNKDSFTKSKKKIKNFVKNLFIIDLDDEHALSNIITEAKKGSALTKVKSRAAILNRFEQTHNALKSMEDKKQDLEIQTFIYDMNYWFPECWKEAEIIQYISSKEESSLTRRILSKAIEYMKKTKMGGHSKGRKSMRRFVKNILEIEKNEQQQLKATAENTPENTAKKNEFDKKRRDERSKFLNENERQYKCSYLWGVSGASIDKKNPSTRQKIFAARSTARH